MKSPRFLLPAVLLLTFVFSDRTSARAENAVPGFESAPCPFLAGKGFVDGKTVHCGYLVVPEDRSQPNSPEIRLAVAIFKSRSKHPAPDPVIFLNGGPGGPTLATLGPLMTRASASTWIGDHDLILIDQRGTGYSQPSLSCEPESADVMQQITPSRASLRQVLTRQEKLVQQCHDRLVGAGVDLSAYNTEENAADIADLRTALGYPEVDLYGVSYGTRLALTVMRTHPAGIRSVVLDSVYAPGINFYTDRLRSGQRAMQALFDGCAKAPSCNTSFPHLKRAFDRLITRLNARPAHVVVQSPGGDKSTKVWVTGTDFYDLTFSMLYATPLIPRLPDIIYQVYEGNWSTAQEIIGALMSQSGGIATGMFLSVECGEDAPTVTAQQIDVAVQTLPQAVHSDERAQDLASLDECKIWNVPGVDQIQRQPVISAIPTLILEGEYDPITSPSYGEMAAKTLSHSYSFQFPGTGHGVRWTSYCPDSMVWSFLDNPTQKLDAICIAQMTEPWS